MPTLSEQIKRAIELLEADYPSSEGLDNGIIEALFILYSVEREVSRG